MKIQPITIWKNGQQITCDKLAVVLTFDNLQTEAKFDYSLLYSIFVENTNEEGQTSQIENVYTADKGVVSMNGENYSNWNGSNQAAIQFVASSLNLTIVNQ